METKQATDYLSGLEETPNPQDIQHSIIFMKNSYNKIQSEVLDLSNRLKELQDQKSHYSAILSYLRNIELDIQTKTDPVGNIEDMVHYFEGGHEHNIPKDIQGVVEQFKQFIK